MEMDRNTVAGYLLSRLHQLGLKHMFGVAGDYLLGFLDHVVASEIKLITCCNELNAGYAADGYARINKIGALAVTYGVGELSALNAVTGAFVEHVPLVMISGAPASPLHVNGKLMHHTLGDYSIPMEMYRKVTVATEIINDAEKAPDQIDKALKACLYHKRPVYLQIPSDAVNWPCKTCGPFELKKRESDQVNLDEAVEEAALMLSNAKRPVILAGIELINHGLQESFKRLLEKSGYPYSTFLLGKTVISENDPQFIGIYQGAWSHAPVKKWVEEADCILLLGAFMTDLDTGGFSTKIDEGKAIQANLEGVKIKHHHYQHVGLHDFINSLTQKLSKGNSKNYAFPAAKESFSHVAQNEYIPNSEQKMTVKRFHDRIARFLRPSDIVLAEAGNSLFSLAETLMPEQVTFIGQSFYTSIGYTVGATLGVSMAAPERRVLLFVGDGAFQVTCQEISTMLRYRLKPIIFLINNDGYTIERVIHDGPYNDIQQWKYHLLPQVFGDGWGCAVSNEGELEIALQHAERSDVLSFVEVYTDRWDCSETMRILGESLAKTNKMAMVK